MKCLHAHYAYLLAGGDDPVGRWAAAQLASADGPEPASATHDPEEGAGEPGRRDRHRHELGPPARRRGRRHGAATPSSCPLDRRMRITRLGQGVDRTRALAPEAIERTVAVLREYRAALDEHGVTDGARHRHQRGA